MQGLILAAGRGSRLGAHTPETPKCLLEVSRRPLIEHQLGACAEAGIAPVAVVLGYCADEVRQVVGTRAEYIHNPRWATTNSIYSFWQARDWVNGPLVVMNCDILFEPAVLSRLLATGGDALVYDSSSGRGLEHMKIKAEGGRLVDMSKELPVEESCGENVGILYFSAETARAVIDRAGEIIEAGHDKTWLAAAVREVARERPLRVVDIAGLAWGEIDTAWDLDNARKTVWPAVKRATGWPRRSRLLSRWAVLPFMPLAIGAGFWEGARSFEPDEINWETVPMQAPSGVQLAYRDRSQSWWVLEHDGAATASLDGPGPVRIDSRLVLHETTAKSPYVLRVEVDGELQDLYKEDGGLDRDARFSGGPVARRKHVTIDLPPNRHTVSIRLVGARPDDRCLVRIRAPEPDADLQTE